MLIRKTTDFTLRDMIIILISEITVHGKDLCFVLFLFEFRKCILRALHVLIKKSF